MSARIEGRPVRLAPTPRLGFTLIEVLGALLLTSIVLTVAIGFFINLSSSSNRAVETMRRQLHATAVLDRISRDLSGASLLAKPEDADPLSHPWYFVSTSRHAFGASDSLEFISLSQRPKVSAYHVSDLAQVAYFTEQADDGTYTLYRWTAPSLPLGYDPIFPDSNSPRSFVLAEGLQGILFRFRTEEGEWVEDWDSTQLVRSGQLPTAVEVVVSLATTAPDEDEELGSNDEAPTYSRIIVLHQRPLDLAQLVEEKIQAQSGLLAGNEDDDEPELDENGNPIEPDGDASAGEGMTVAECVIANMPACQAEFGAGNCEIWSNINSLKIATFGISVPPSWGCR